tara:strand:+ start:1922 stop:3103 length:1182 start_codon:yes stop_codon:yes gene_type:complete
MQLYIQILLLFINPFVQEEIDTTKHSSFNIKGEKYSFGGYNEVFKLDGDSLKRIDNSVDSRVTINAYIFKLNDTVIKYGGYGFWSQRNFMYYFDITSFEWEIYRINYEDNLEGSFDGYQNSTDESIIFYGGKKVNPNKRIELNQSKEVVLFNKKNRKLEKVGTLSFEILNKEYLCSTKNLSFFYDDEFFYKIDPTQNKIHKYYKPTIFYQKIFNSSFDEENNIFKINKIINNTGSRENIILDGGFLTSPIDEFELYKTPVNKLIYSPLLLIFVIFFIIYKNYKTNKTILSETYFIHNKSRYDIGIEDLSLLKQLIIQNEINFNDVMNFYQNSSLSYGHNTRISNEKLGKLSIRLKSILKLKDQPILKKKSNVDKRQKIIVLSKEFREIKITLK